MSTITRVGAGTAATANNGASVTPTVHASTAAGDMVFVFTSVRNSGTGVPVAPAGWTTLVLFGNVGTFARIWQAGDVVPAFTFTGGAAGDDTTAQSETWRGVSAEALLNVPTAATLLNPSGANIPYPALAVPKDRCLVFLCAWKQSDITTLSTPAGMTAAQTTTALAGNDAAVGLRYRIETTATDITGGTLTTTGGVSAISRAFLIALKPAASISVIVQDVYPTRVLVSVTDLTLGDAVAIYRSVAGVRTLVQGASSAAVTDPSFLRVDGTLPFGVAVTYVAVVNGVEYASAPATYTLAGGKVVVTDAISATASEVVIWAWPRKVRDRQATIFRPAGRNVVVSGNLSLPESDIELYTDAYSSTQSLVELIENTTQGIVQIRGPGPQYDGVDGFYAVTTYAERRFSQDGSDEKRIHELHIVEVDGWAAAFTALGFTYADLSAAYTGLTYANVAADYATYLLLAQADLS